MKKIYIAPRTESVEIKEQEILTSSNYSPNGRVKVSNGDAEDLGGFYGE